MKNIRQIKQLVNLLETGVTDKECTVNELLVKANNILNEEKEKALQFDNEIIAKYKNVYFKRIDKERSFGTTVEIFKIDSVVRDSYDEDWNPLFRLIGCRYSFSLMMGIGFREFDDRADSLFNVNKFKNFIEITEDEFNMYVEKYNQVYSVLTKIIEQ